jgi:DNA-binding transcriptional regulator WhiA
MRTKEEYEKVKILLDEGLNPTDIAKITGLPRRTIYDWKVRPPKSLTGNAQAGCQNCKDSLTSVKERIIANETLHSAYSYLLGLYLGDGCISKHPRTYRLRIALDKKYDKLNDYAKEILTKVFINNTIGVVNREGCIHLSVYYSGLPIVFPHTGEGKKHDRPIVLEQWQKDILDPTQFLKGLFHSDGSYYLSRGNGYYNFTNFSKDIIELYKSTCDKLELSYAEVNYKSGKNVINHNKRDVVKKMMKMFGTKTCIVE